MIRYLIGMAVSAENAISCPEDVLQHLSLPKGRSSLSLLAWAKRYRLLE